MKVLCYGMALLSITACTEDEYLVDESSEKIISANIEAPLLFGEEEVVDKSRTYVYEDESLTSGMATMWRAKEVIGVYSTGILGQKNVKFTGTNKSDAATASFSGVTISSPKYAYYPFSDDNDGVSSSNVKMNSVGNGYYSCDVPDGKDKIIFVRKNPAHLELSFDNNHLSINSLSFTGTSYSLGSILSALAYISKNEYKFLNVDVYLE